MGPPSPSGEPKPGLLRSIAADKAVVGEAFVVGAGAGRAIARDPLRGACETLRVYRYPACEAAPIKERRGPEGFTYCLLSQRLPRSVWPCGMKALSRTAPERPPR